MARRAKFGHRGIMWLALGASALAGLVLAAVPAHARAATAFQRGLVMTGWTAGSYLAPRADSAIRHMADVGTSNAGLFTQWFMDTPVSSHIAPDPALTPTDASITHAAARMRAAGMEVTLKPQVGIRGNVWIGNAAPRDLDAFWASYRTMMLHYADLGERIGASTLVIGTEMRTLSWDEARWRALIAELRLHFHGALTYAANYDEFESVRFWDALDYVGIDAYFALADESDPAPSVAELARAWTARGYLERMAAVSRRTGKQVLLTELGYRGIRGTATHPGRWDAVDAIDPQAQADAYQAFYLGVAGQPWLAGVYWWSVDADKWWAGDYSPLGKPAADVMRTWNMAAATLLPETAPPPRAFPLNLAL